MSGDAQRWDDRYRTGDTPWDSRIVSRELVRCLDSDRLQPVAARGGSALELGCGTGTNALELDQRGFQVTAVDFSARAITEARSRAAEIGAEIDWIVGDVCQLDELVESFDFVFDRGCYHCVRKSALDELLATLQRLTRPGSVVLILAGNANENSDDGPPRVTEDELRSELGQLFTIEHLEAFRFQDPGGVDGPLGWSCLGVRAD